ncbi:MAG: alpha/beta hydrolase-fold protein [Bacteroidetes bacterium]|nr:alpha/beta hydrolase-fold protein [Bacteroidota bacterium]
MKKACLFFFLTTLFSLTNAQNDNKIVIGTIDSVYSKILNEQRKVWVHVPNQETTNLFAKQQYPVIYLLDGDAHFSSVVGLIEQLSGNSICPEMIVVGIPNTDRNRDLTPTPNTPGSPSYDSIRDKTSGGGEAFSSFLEKELIPHIDSLYPTAPYRLLIGHSHGALTAISILTHHTHLFNSYLAIDPSLWWDNKKLLKQTETALGTKNFSGTSLYLAIANTLPQGMDTIQMKNDTTGTTLHQRCIFELRNALNKNKKSGLTFETKYYPDDNHGSVPLIATYDALRFLFKFYSLKLTDRDGESINEEVISKMESHYEKVSKLMGYKVCVPESTINNLGYQSLGNNHLDAAEMLFKMNTVNYPESFNVFDSLGDLYVAKGDKVNAVINYKKALAINKFPETKQKLEKLLEN